MYRIQTVLMSMVKTTYFIVNFVRELYNYVGETGTNFRLCFDNHTKSIRDNFLGFPVSGRDNLPNHYLLI